MLKNEAAKPFSLAFHLVNVRVSGELLSSKLSAIGRFAKIRHLAIQATFSLLFIWPLSVAKTRFCTYEEPDFQSLSGTFANPHLAELFAGH